MGGGGGPTNFGAQQTRTFDEDIYVCSTICPRFFSKLMSVCPRNWVVAMLQSR